MRAPPTYVPVDLGLFVLCVMLGFSVRFERTCRWGLVLVTEIIKHIGKHTQMNSQKLYIPPLIGRGYQVHPMRAPPTYVPIDWGLYCCVYCMV